MCVIESWSVHPNCACSSVNWGIPLPGLQTLCSCSCGWTVFKFGLCIWNVCMHVHVSKKIHCGLYSMVNTNLAANYCMLWWWCAGMDRCTCSVEQCIRSWTAMLSFFIFKQTCYNIGVGCQSDLAVILDLHTVGLLASAIRLNRREGREVLKIPGSSRDSNVGPFNYKLDTLITELYMY